MKRDRSEGKRAGRHHKKEKRRRRGRDQKEERIKEKMKKQ